jgi:hypothetical protein
LSKIIPLFLENESQEDKGNSGERLRFFFVQGIYI